MVIVTNEFQLIAFSKIVVKVANSLHIQGGPFVTELVFFAIQNLFSNCFSCENGQSNRKIC